MNEKYDDFLEQFRKAPPPGFADALYQKISRPAPARPRLRLLRLAAAALVIAVLVCAGLLVSPSMRAFAGGIVRQFGSLIFIQGMPAPDAAQPTKQTPAALTTPEVKALAQPAGSTPAGGGGPKVGQVFVNAAEAARQAGFAVLTLSYLPAGYAVDSIQPGYLVQRDSTGINVLSPHYVDADGNGFIIAQSQLSAGPDQTYLRPEIVDVTVRGYPGVWLPAGRKNSLIWTEGGITYTITADVLSMQETLKIATSLGK